MTRKQRFAKAKEEALRTIEAIPAPNMSKVNLHEVFADCGQLANLETAAKRIIESYDNDTYIRPTNGLFPSLWGYEEYLDLYIDEDGIEAFRPILSEYIDSCTLDGLYDYLKELNYDKKLSIFVGYANAIYETYKKYRLFKWKQRRQFAKAIKQINKQTQEIEKQASLHENRG